MNTPIDLLNNTEHTGTFMFWLLIVLAVWCMIWRLFLGDWLRTHDVGTFWFAMYEFGPVGTFGLALVLLVLLALLITSIKASFIYGGKLILAICAFWGGLIFCLIKVIKTIKK